MNRCAFCNLFSALSHKSFGVISQLACFFKLLNDDFIKIILIELSV